MCSVPQCHPHSICILLIHVEFSWKIFCKIYKATYHKSSAELKSTGGHGIFFAQLLNVHALIYLVVLMLDITDRFDAQYLVYHPLASISPCTRSGILSITPSNTSAPIDHQTSCTRSVMLRHECIDRNHRVLQYQDIADVVRV